MRLRSRRVLVHHRRVLLYLRLGPLRRRRCFQLARAFLYLPPYSPDLNPIEQAFSKVKGSMRKAEARTREALIGAMGQALNAVTAKDVRGFFGHCGYRSMDQLL